MSEDRPWIVLVEPEIPPNTGNVGRTCVGLGLPLVLVGPLGFSLDDRRVRRAGLDYWPRLDVRRRREDARFWDELAARRPLLFSRFAGRLVWEVDLRGVGALCFGSESRGLPQRWFDRGFETARFPSTGAIRSYNLAACVHSAALEWVRQVRPAYLIDPPPPGRPS